MKIRTSQTLPKKYNIFTRIDQLATYGTKCKLCPCIMRTQYVGGYSKYSRIIDLYQKPLVNHCLKSLVKLIQQEKSLPKHEMASKTRHQIDQGTGSIEDFHAL